jgi:hypothetical protein
MLHQFARLSWACWDAAAGYSPRPRPQPEVVVSWFGLILAVMVSPADPPAVPVLQAPTLTRGDRIPFAGEVTDISDAAGRKMNRAWTLDVSLFVLDVSDAATDCAVFTRVTPKTDPGVVAAAADVLGTAPDGRAKAPVSHLELVRIDGRGRVIRLAPPGRPPPFRSDSKAAGESLPACPMDEPPRVEVGMFVPLPETATAVGDSWAAADGSRPARTWTVKGSEFLNGGRCFVVEATQQSTGWTDFAKSATGWHRSDRLLVSPSDGLARDVSRQIVQREGNAVVRTLTVRYEIRPAVPHEGASYRDVRTEIEWAAWLGGELGKAMAVGKSLDTEAVERVRDRAKQLEEDRPATAFRPALEAVRLRAEAVLAGRALGDR